MQRHVKVGACRVVVEVPHEERHEEEYAEFKCVDDVADLDYFCCSSHVEHRVVLEVHHSFKEWLLGAAAAAARSCWLT